MPLPGIRGREEVFVAPGEGEAAAWSWASGPQTCSGFEFVEFLVEVVIGIVVVCVAWPGRLCSSMRTSPGS